MKSFGEEYARQVIRNAQALARALAEAGFPVVCSELGYTQSHQVFLDYGGYRQGKTIAPRLEKANIICDSRVRLGTCEVTRRGMKETQMRQIAGLMKGVVIDEEEASRVKATALRIAKEFDGVEYRFS